MNSRRLAIESVVAAAFLLASAPVALAEAPPKAPADAGLLFKVTGKVTYKNEAFQKDAAEAKSYMKIRVGDVITVPEGGSVELAYFSGNRKETWKGPVTIKVGLTESTVQSGKDARPEVTKVPAGATDGVKRIPSLLRKAGAGRAGATHVRGTPGKSDKKPAPPLSKEEQAEIAAAREVYAELKNASADGDATPDLYLLGVLADYEQYEEMEKLVVDALKKAPKSEELKAIEKWLKEQKK
ncbi:MAG: hypothetical protein HY897_14545 [Deltaproteobacteria bacterium]|nr:hypothetical protein [Deltaproteobacteria bacterium]